MSYWLVQAVMTVAWSGAAGFLAGALIDLFSTRRS